MRTLSETETRYQTLIEQIPAVTYMESAAEPGKKLYVSPQVRTILGFEPTDWSHEGWLRGDPSRRSRTRARRGSPDPADRRAVQLRVPDGATRTGGSSGSRTMPCCCGTTAAIPLYWQGVRFDITASEGSRRAPPRSRAAVPHARRADPGDHLHRRVSEPGRPAPLADHLHQPAGRDDPRVLPEEWRTDRDLWGRLIHPDDVERSLEADRRHYRDRRATRHGDPPDRQGRLDPLDPGRGDHGPRRRRAAPLEPGHPAGHHRTQARRAAAARRGRALPQPDRDDPRGDLHRHGRRGVGGRVHEPTGARTSSGSLPRNGCGNPELWEQGVEPGGPARGSRPRSND